LTVSLDPEDCLALPIAAEFLARQVIGLKFLVPKLIDLHSAHLPFSMCEVGSDGCARPAVGKVGCTNLCRTYYLDSVLGSFLRSACWCPPSGADDGFPLRVGDSFLVIYRSNSCFLSPTAFVSHYVLHGCPLDCQEQQDAVEVLLSCSDSDQEVLFLFSPTLQNTITVDDFEKTMVEQIVTLDLEVAEHASLIESFWTLVGDDGAIIRMNAMKTTLITSSPPVLVLHLKCFAFDIERQERRKIHNELALSATIDIWQSRHMISTARSSISAARAQSTTFDISLRAAVKVSTE
jgi:hypothetical protein